MQKKYFNIYFTTFYGLPYTVKFQYDSINSRGLSEHLKWADKL